MGGEGREEEHLSHCILLRVAGEGKSVFEVYYVYKEYYISHCRHSLVAYGKNRYWR